MRIVLASSSPSRRMILSSAGVDPLIRPADVDEDALLTSLAEAPPAERVAALAEAKAQAVAGDFPGDVVIGGDSMLLLDGRLQGKPHTPERTIGRWREQAGKKAELLTGHCVLFGEQKVVETTSTLVYFAQASEADIAAYAHSGEPLQCAGAFTLEALGGWFIDRIEGDPSSVIGLSLPLVRRALYSFGLNVNDFWNR
ncbi:septum formation inhibitor Maf [Corynebacterium hylobatis]|uniref:Nucleoside triphosphate pyrophosphatase n=1 Tax=Corynebacterium hylobatis TaxID=1859290 RepID=A0A3R9ZYP4_9CORY|nr:nucleoside triphosphate pyrophosphatase [Corynebacterium hylobatis]RSZ61803.1 septum formation inhibitor Maf [Corynebacterium hylobatis]